MFNKLFNKNTVPCACEGNSEHCDLIIQLREKQAVSKGIKDEIETLNKNRQKSLNDFVDFLKVIDSVCTYRECRWDDYFREDILEQVINKDSFANIIKVIDALSTYKNNMCLIAEKQKVLKAVEDDIKEIKSKLGIE